jgi:hypothetical protein
MTSPLELIYEKYKHLDGPLSDTEWCTSGEGAAIYAIAGELWRAVKEAREQQQEIIPSADIIADLEQSLEFYRTRMNNLQCWQSSMRDPERKIVCDILANGFTLTTKEEIDNAGNRPRPPCEECVWQPALRMKCPKCGAPTWIRLSDGFQTIFCYSAACDWKHQIRPDGHDSRIAAQATAAENKRVLDEIGLNCWGEYKMNNRRCMICQVGERCYDKRESLRLAQPKPKGREPE